MKRRTIPYFLLLCGWLIGTLFSPALAAPERGVGVLADGGGLTFYNSIVWDNGPGTVTLSGSNNLTGENPLFASETDFLPLAGSPARGAGNNAHWNTLAGIARVDIAGVAHGNPINIGAYETDVTYTVTIPSTVTVYLGSKALVSGESVAGGTELTVIANVQAGMKLEVLTANGMPITNGAPFILVANTTFEATFVPVRKDVYATMKDGTGRLNVYNSIIYDNVDLFGNYTLDATNMIADPKFDSSTHFTLQDDSPAMELGDAAKLPAGVTSDVAGVTIEASRLNTGAFQTAQYAVSWSVTNGTLEVFKSGKDDSGQTIETQIASGEMVNSGTKIIVRARAHTGYYLTTLKYNDVWVNVGDASKDPLKNALLDEGSFNASVATVITATFASTGGLKVGALIEGGTFLNNIAYDNNGHGSNLTEADPQNPVNNAIDLDPKFTSQTNFRLGATSTLLNKGEGSALPEGVTTDLAGSTRIQGSVVDMGAYESSSQGFTVIYRPETVIKNEVVATVELYDGSTLIESGTLLPAETVLTVKVTLNNEHYEQQGRIRLNDGTRDSYIDGTTFTLTSNTTVNVDIRAKQYTLTYTTTGATALVYSGSTLVASGSEISYDSYLTVQILPAEYHELQLVTVNGVQIEGAELAGGYVVRVSGDVAITASAVALWVLDENGEPVLDEDSNPIPVVGGLFSWDVQNATITATAGGSPVNMDDVLAPGTEVTFTITPTNPDLGILLYQLNGVDLDMTKQTFTVTIPAADASGKVAPTFIGVIYGEGGWKPGDPDPDPTETIYVTMVIPDTLPEGITLNPAPGTYQVAVGSSRVLRFTVDEQYEDQYVFLRINGDYVMVKAPQGLLDFAYTLIDIRQALTIEVIISDTANPEEGTVGNATLTPGVRVTGESGKLTVESDRATKVLVYTVGGKLVANGAVNGTKEFYLPAGIYIVRTTISTPVKAVVR